MTDNNLGQSEDELTKILDASGSLFDKYGIRSVTMSDIAKELGMSKKTLYVHIKNKHDLVHRLMQRELVQDQWVISQILEEASNALDAMLRVGIYAQQQINKMNPSLLYDLKKYHRPSWEMFDDFHRNSVLEMIEHNLRQGVEEGWYRSDLNVSLVARVHISLMPLLSDPDFFPPEQFPTSDIHCDFMQYHLYAIVSEKGRSYIGDKLKEWLSKEENNRPLA